MDEERRFICVVFGGDGRYWLLATGVWVGLSWADD